MSRYFMRLHFINIYLYHLRCLVCIVDYSRLFTAVYCAHHIPPHFISNCEKAPSPTIHVKHTHFIVAWYIMLFYRKCGRNKFIVNCMMPNSVVCRLNQKDEQIVKLKHKLKRTRKRLKDYELDVNIIECGD
jgi:hypothetical protein